MMTELKSWYRERIPARIAALEEIREQLKTPSPESTATVRRIAHSLRGSGATYGFSEITESARMVEESQEDELLPRVEGLIRTLGSVHAGSPAAKTSILIVEDDEDQARYAARALASPDREILEARTAEEAQAILDEREVSLILLDLILPDADGRDFLSRLRQRLTTATVPVVILTVKRASQAKAECVAIGADDFLEKPVKAEALSAVVAARLRLGPVPGSEVDRDPLTGFLNRAAFMEQFRRIRAGITCSGEPAAAAILAVDDFDAIVKQHGGRTADAVMRHAAAVLSRNFRSGDVLARSGGCEFAVLFPKTNAAGASIALGKAHRTLRETPLTLGKGRVLELGFSSGLASLAPGKILVDVLAEAERHLHLAREAGGGRVVSAQDKIVPPRRRILIADDDELIRLVLQRLFELEGYETLLFSDGRAALDGALQNQVSMIITDGSMPVMDGFELVRRLRTHPNYRAVPVVMLTSMGSEEDVVRGLELGADDYVLKPFSSAELLARVRRLIRRLPLRV